MRDNIKVDVLDLLAVLKVDNIHEIGRGEVAYSCPLTDGHAFGDAHPSAHMQKANALWRCKTCHAQGNAFDFVVAAKRCSPMEALRFLRERYGQEFRPPEGGELAKEREQIEAQWAHRDRQLNPRRPVEEEWIGQPQAAFYVDWTDVFRKFGSGQPQLEYMLRRGFSPAQLRDWQIGYDSWTDRIAIPIRDEQGSLLGFKGRAWRDDMQPRYLLLGDTPDRKPRYGYGYGFDMFDPVQSAAVFGLDRAAKFGSKRVVVCEGELNVIALHAYGVGDAVAFGASWFSDGQLRALRWHAEEAIIFFDSDDAGERATWGYIDEKEREHPGLVERLIDYMSVKVAPTHVGDPAELGKDRSLELIDQAADWKSFLKVSLPV